MEGVMKWSACCVLSSYSLVLLLVLRPAHQAVSQAAHNTHTFCRYLCCTTTPFFPSLFSCSLLSLPLLLLLLLLLVSLYTRKLLPLPFFSCFLLLVGKGRHNIYIVSKRRRDG